jgi:hypothetical protein
MRVPWIIKWAIAADPIKAFSVWVEKLSHVVIIVDEKTMELYVKDVNAALKTFPWGAIAGIIWACRRGNFR